MNESKQWLTVIKFFRLYFIDSLKKKAIVNIFFDINTKLTLTHDGVKSYFQRWSPDFFRPLYAIA